MIIFFLKLKCADICKNFVDSYGVDMDYILKDLRWNLEDLLKETDYIDLETKESEYDPIDKDANRRFLK